MHMGQVISCLFKWCVPSYDSDRTNQSAVTSRCARRAPNKKLVRDLQLSLAVVNLNHMIDGINNRQCRIIIRNIRPKNIEKMTRQELIQCVDKLLLTAKALRDGIKFCQRMYDNPRDWLCLEEKEYLDSYDVEVLIKLFKQAKTELAAS